MCRSLIFVPPCKRCGEKDWRDEIESLTLPCRRDSAG